MAFLAPAAAAAGTGATVGFAAPALAKMGATAATAGSALSSGIAAGSALAGGGASMAAMPALSYAGMGLSGALPAVSSGLPGLAAGFNPASYLSASGLGGALPAATNTLPALVSASPALSQVAPNFVGREQLMQAFSRPGIGQGLPQLGPKLAGPADASYLTSMQPTSIPSLEIRQAADLTTGFGPKTGLNMPTGVTEGLKLKTPISAETPLAQGPLSFREMLASGIDPKANAFTNAMNLIQNPSMQGLKDYAQEHPYVTSAAVGLGTKALLSDDKKKAPEQDKGMIRPYEFTRAQRPEAYAVSPLVDTSERRYFNDQFIAQTPYPADSEEAKKASGGIAKAYAVGGPVEQMAAMNAVGANTGYPMAGINTPMYTNPMVQRPETTNVIAPTVDAGVGAYTGEPRFASGGLSDLGSYSDGGRLLKGPGNGTSDSIPAIIGNKQPARLADGEFVIPARIVSELGNGSTDAGARQLYKMMDRIQNARRKTVGKDKVAVDAKARKHLPA